MKLVLAFLSRFIYEFINFCPVIFEWYLGQQNVHVGHGNIV